MHSLVSVNIEVSGGKGRHYSEGEVSLAREGTEAQLNSKSTSFRLQKGAEPNVLEIDDASLTITLVKRNLSRC